VSFFDYQQQAILQQVLGQQSYLPGQIIPFNQVTIGDGPMWHIGTLGAIPSSQCDYCGGHHFEKRRCESCGAPR
jgi:hypothetical protein